MSDIPVLRSKEQIAGQLIDGIVARLRKDIDLNNGSVITQIVEAISQGMFKSSADIITMINALNADRATGEALQRQANDANVPIFSAFAATGLVNITDTTFTMVSSSIYAGQPAPVAGSLIIYVADASLFPPGGGQIYIGRGTTNVEGPLTYTAATSVAGGSYWSITLAATSPTTSFHNIGETVILAQGGNRLIQSGTTVQTPQGASIAAVAFKTTSDATIQDGAVTVVNVPVQCQTPGVLGNVGPGNISQIVGVPFSGTVTNPLGFTNGIAADTDTDIQDRIKEYEIAKSKGTDQAIETASIGVIAPDSLAMVTSANVITYADNTTELIFDTGSGYEATFLGAPLETVVLSAVGGEENLQLRQIPVVQCLVENTVASPYPMTVPSNLAVMVEGVLTVHTFQSTDFLIPSAATAQEIAASINSDININFSASTANNGTNVVVYPTSRTVNNIQVMAAPFGTDANAALGFSLNPQVTLHLYKNNLPLYQDGVVATVLSRAQTTWSSSISPNDTLIYQVDNTPAVTVTVTTDAFQAIDINATVSYSTSINTWAAALNSLMPGVEVAVVGNQLGFTSARGASSQAAISFIGGTLLDQIFSTTGVLSAVGQTSDYTLNRFTSQIGLTVPLQPGDQVTAGSQYTNGNALTASMPSGPSVAGRVWVITDGDSENVPNGLDPNTNVTFTKAGTTLTITGTSPSSTPQGFDEAAPGDWVIVWANPTDPAPLISNQGFWRILTVATGQITVDDGTTVRSNLGVSFVPLSSRIVIVSSTAPVQLLSFDINSLVNFQSEVVSQLIGVNAVISGSAVRISTATNDPDGQIFFAAADAGGSSLNLPIGIAQENTQSPYGFVSITDAEAGVPSFAWSTLGTASADSVFSVPDYYALGGSQDDFLQILDGFTTSPLAIVPATNKSRRSLSVSYDGATELLTLDVPTYMQTGEAIMNAGDRFFLRSSFKFYSDDATTAVVDGNVQTESYSMPVARQLIVSSWSTPTTQSFSATDAQSTLLLSSPNSFYDFDFSNFKIHRQSRTILTNGVYSIQINNADYGPSGDTVRVGLVYPPSVLNTSLSSNFGQSDAVDAEIYLPVTTVRTPNWDYTTSFTVSKTTTGGADTLTFTWQSGTQPNFSVSGANVQVGDIVFISSTANFLPANTGITAQVIGVTPTSFTIKLPTGDYSSDAVTFSNILNQSGTITVTTDGSHNLVTGQTVGFYNTASPDGGATYPFNTTYTVTVVSPTVFTVVTPVAVPAALVQTAQQFNNVVTMTVATAIDLTVGDIILVSGSGSPFDGLASVLAVNSSTQFTYIRSGASASSATGRVDFQTYLPGATVAISTLSQSGYLVTVDTSAALPSAIVPGAIVSIAGATAFNGTYVVNSTGSETFSFYYSATGSGTGTGGTATAQVPTGSMARAIGGLTNANLQFGVVSTTAQQVVDYISNNIPGYLSGMVTNGAPNAVITASTQDSGINTNYYTASVVALYTFETSRRARIQLSANAPAGSTIDISGMTGNAAPYNGQYVVLNTYLDSGLGVTVSVIQLESLALTTGSVTGASAGTVTGSLPMQMMYDGENDVSSSDLQAVVTQPMFNAKNAWISPPAIGEQLRLVVVDNDQLVRFWNELVVTGFSNVGEVELTRYGREVQLSTQTFGGSGSVQVSGGAANSLAIAIVGAGDELTTKASSVTVPVAIHKGLITNQWINLLNNVAQNKEIGIDESTIVQLTGTTMAITGGDGTFQTQRAVTYTAATQLKLEFHGAFLAVIGVGGPSMSLLTNGVQEGDWVRLYDTQESAWSPLTTYATGARVYYGTRNYTSLQSGNVNNEPDTSPTYWQVQEFNPANTGIYQVVRIFGQDSFWIVAPNAVEEIITLGDVANLAFYSYDSVMPNDVLIINTNVLGSANVGRYTVVDNSFGPGYSFPNSTTIWVTPTIPNPGSPVTLGGEYNQVNIQEANALSLWKRIYAVGPANGSLTNIMLDSPNLTSRISSSLGGQVVAQGKLGFSTALSQGEDAYKYYTGLIAQLTKVIYGDPTDPINYPGWRASGSPVGINPATLLNINVAFAVRLNTVVPFTEVIANIQNAVAGYVNNLDVGESVSLAACIAAAMTVPGVTSAVITSPTYSASSDLIPVNANQKAFIINPTIQLPISLITATTASS